MIFLCVLFSAPLFAQTKTVTGRVSDSLGNPLSNVSVQVRNERGGVRTDERGSFTIPVPLSNPTLVISYVGYEEQRVNVGNQESITVTLTPTRQNLQEVVVVAYGTQRRESMTGSVNRIDGSKIAERPVTNVVSALAGAAPGLQANAGSGQPGTAPAIRIRGFGSINASNDPLFVVDGVPYAGNIANINVDDVESITLLKDAASTAIYGARAANGVVMITTKKGKRGRPQINVRVSRGFSSRAIPEYDRVNAYDYYPLMWEALRNSLAYRTTNPVPMAQANQTASGLVAGQNGVKDVLAYNPFNVAATDIVRPDGTLNPSAQLIYRNEDLDWEKAISRTGIRDDYNVNYGGASERSDYFFSLGYLKDRGYTIKTDYERYTGRVNMNTQLASWFRTGINLNGTFVKSNFANDPTAALTSSTAFVNPFFFSRGIGPIYPIYAQQQGTGNYILDANGAKQYDLGNLSALGLPVRPGGGYGGRHIVAETLFNENFFNSNVWSARTFGEVSFLRHFKFTANAAVDVINRSEVSYQNKIVGDGAPAGNLTKENNVTTTTNFNQLLNFSKGFGVHTVEALVGHESYNFKDDNNSATRSNQIVDNIYELINFTTTTGLTSYLDRYRVEGYFSRANYSYAGKYLFSFSYRRDGSSRFSRDARWGNFYSVSAAWRLDREKFIESLTWINSLKLRTSYGETGNDNVRAQVFPFSALYYPSQPLYGLGWNNGTTPGIIRGNYADPSSAVPGNVGSLGNPVLTWETNKSFDVGLEFGLFKNRLSGTVEFFNRQSDNLLFEVPLPVSSGVQSQIRNVGSMYNRGWEASITGEVLRKKDFSWSMTVNATTFENRITRLPQSEIIPNETPQTKKLMVGHSIYDYWLRDYQGIDPTDGSVLYRAATYNASNSRIRGKDDTVTINQNNALFAYHGSAIPDVFGSVMTSVRFKFFELSALASYQFGGKVYDATYQALMSSGNYGGAAHTDLLKRWKAPGDITTVPRMDAGQTAAFNAVSSRWLVDASNLYLRNVTLSVTLPQGLIQRARIQNARFYVSGENLALFSKRKGLNVEQNFAGVTSNVYNPARIITVGLNLSL